MSDPAPGAGLDATLRGFSGGQKVFDRYRLIRTLGRGGMGIVWLAHDDPLEREVALKFVPELVVLDPAVLNELKRETKRSLELTHKNIVRIYDFVHDATSACISMEYIDGGTLSSLRVKKENRIFEAAEIAEWISQLCDALDYAHNDARIVHRDLKPSNLMVNQRVELKVADFGIARSLSDSMSMLTHTRGTSGTLIYMSPQQLDGEHATHLDDIYSLGATIYELLTSRPPFYSGNIDRQIREKIPPPMAQRRKDLEVEAQPIPQNWEETVAACLAKDPAKRPQSVIEVAERLQLSGPAPPRDAPSLGKRAKQNSLVAIGAAATIIVLVGLTLFVGRRPPSPRSPKHIEQATVTKSTPEKDFASAMEYLSGMNKVRIDVAKSVELLRRAADQHFPEAEARLASWTRDGLFGIARDAAIAEQLAKQSLGDGLEAAANNGRATAQEAVGLLYYSDIGVPRDYSKAVEWYQKAADQGWVSGQYTLGFSYANGYGVTKDFAKAAELFQKAADQGSALAQAWLGSLYQNGQGLTKDLGKAVELYQKAADQGHADAQNNLGFLYQNGQGVSKDLAKAIELYQKAADQGNTKAQCNLAYLYQNGQGVTKDLGKAVELYQKAADQGYANGQYGLGWCYEHQQGVAKDLTKAAELYEKSAAQGNTNAQNNLGSLYYNGQGVIKDLGKAAELFQKATDQGNANAEGWLGYLYERGEGVTKDLKKAAELYQKAIVGGNQHAVENLRRLQQAQSSAVAQETSREIPTATVVPSPVNTGYNPAIAFVDMNRVFKEYDKTKGAEAKINDAKNQAKKEYDDRANAYRAALNEIAGLNKEIDSSSISADAKSTLMRQRDDKIAKIKKMETEITDFRQSRERQLQEQARRMREGIVEEINRQVQLLGGAVDNLILDKSGNSLNGVPVFVFSTEHADRTQPVLDALNQNATNSFAPSQNLRFAVVDMNKVFKNYRKTKEAEDKINTDKNAAKKEYDDRANTYKAKLAEVGKMKSGPQKDKAMRDVSAMEREINEWRTAKEKQLQDAALKLRVEIVNDITGLIGDRLISKTDCVVVDISGAGLGNAPLVPYVNKVPDFSDQIIVALNQGERKGASVPFVWSHDLRFGKIDMNRTFKVLPEGHRAEEDIVSAKQAAARELGDKPTPVAKEAKDKELKDSEAKLRQSVMTKIQSYLIPVAEKGGFNIIFDATGNTLNGVPAVLTDRAIPDVTDDVIKRANGN